MESEPSQMPHFAATSSSPDRSRPVAPSLRPAPRAVTRARPVAAACVSLLCGFLAAIALENTAAAAPRASGTSRPNIVLIISDDHDNEHLGFLGSREAYTPQLDRLARQGTVFRLAHLPMSRCHPTLASFLSGRWPHQTGIYYNYGTKTLSPENSLPNLLQEAGYATYVEGKYWEGDPRQMGFTHGKGKTAKTFVREGQQDLFRFIEQEGGKRPLFIWWAPLMPHTPHNPPPRWKQRFAPEKLAVPDWIAADKHQAYRRRQQLSYAMESWMDEGVGQLVDKLQSEGLYENTLFAFLIDNGWCNGLPSKGSPFEKGVRTPMFVSWPGKIPAGKAHNCLTSTLDLFPTLLEYAGARVPSGTAGRSLRPVIDGATDQHREQLFGAIYPAFATVDDQRPERDVYALYVRDERWKYIYYVQDVVPQRNGKYFRIQSILTDFPQRKRGDHDLYDLQADPYERRDLADLPEHAERIRASRQAILKWWKETGGKPWEGSE